jgi:c-di-GMP-binding flagellar brake protein YcgR
MSEKENSPHFGLANFERRQHPRFLINLPVEYSRLDQSGNRPAQTADVSEGGLLLHVSDELDIGQGLKITLFIDSGSGLKPIKAKGKVVWKDYQFGKDGSHRVGVNFLEIKPEHQKTLKNFLSNLSQIGSMESQIPDRLLSALNISEIKSKNGSPGFVSVKLGAKVRGAK